LEESEEIFIPGLWRRVLWVKPFLGMLVKVVEGNFIKNTEDSFFDRGIFGNLNEA
jgi:hypothetical protein